MWPDSRCLAKSASNVGPPRNLYSRTCTSAHNPWRSGDHSCTQSLARHKFYNIYDRLRIGATYGVACGGEDEDARLGVRGGIEQLELQTQDGQRVLEVVHLHVGGEGAEMPVSGRSGFDREREMRGLGKCGFGVRFLGM
jgi:hypothetical protein